MYLKRAARSRRFKYLAYTAGETEKALSELGLNSPKVHEPDCNNPGNTVFVTYRPPAARIGVKIVSHGHSIVGLGCVIALTVERKLVNMVMCVDRRFLPGLGGSRNEDNPLTPDDLKQALYLTTIPLQKPPITVATSLGFIGWAD